jgi:hypothetical protein
LWNTCYPRIYREPRNGTFYSPKLVGAELFTIALKDAAGLKGAAETYEFIAASALVKYWVPIFFIAPSMMEALTNTTISHARSPSLYVCVKTRIYLSYTVESVPNIFVAYKENKSWHCGKSVSPQLIQQF